MPRTKPVERICEVCGKHFFTRDSTVKKGFGKMCSRLCADTSKKLAPRRQMTRTCQRCGKVFATTNRSAKYCSRECFNPPVLKVCEKCGTEFRVSPSANDQRYCSTLCANTSEEKSAGSKQRTIEAWQKPEIRLRMMAGIERRSNSEEWRSAPHFQRGEAHPRYKGSPKSRIEASRYEYIAWRKAVYKKDNYTCQQCGKRGGKLQAHHIQSWAEHPELRYEVSNGLSLCEDCHIAIHGNYRRPYMKQCTTCGQNFRPRSVKTKFCSRACFYVSMKKASGR